MKTILYFLSILLSVSALANTKSPTQQADSLMTQWVAIEKQNAQLKVQWQENKGLLQQRLALLKQEQKQLQSLSGNHHKKVDDVAREREQLLTLQTSIETTQQQLSRWLDREFAQVNNIAGQLPPPLTKSWQETLATLDQKNISNRLETLLTLYQKFSEFNGRISTTQDSITDTNGQEKVVQQIYLGVARGWYLSLDGTTAIAGVPSAEGWVWQHNKPLDPQPLKDALAMIKHQQEARLVTLPLSLTSQP